MPGSREDDLLMITMKCENIHREQETENKQQKINKNQHTADLRWAERCAAQRPALCEAFYCNLILANPYFLQLTGTEVY